MKSIGRNSSEDITNLIYNAAPINWRKTPLKRLGDYQNGYAFKPEQWGDFGLPIIRIAQLTSDRPPNFFDGDIDNRNKIKKGDLLFSWSATLDAFIWNGDDAWLNQHIFKVTPGTLVDLRFLFYLIKMIAPKLSDIDAHGSAMQHIKKEHLSFPVYVPNVERQSAIAKLLDLQVAKIDELIGKQERLLELLAEKRQAVITNAVTKGLEPNAPMKDSNIDWIGKIPRHWNLIRTKELFAIRKRIAGTEDFEVLSITQKGIKKKDITSGEGQLALDYSKYQIVEEGDFAMNHMDLLTGYVDISKYNGVTSPDYRVFVSKNNSNLNKYFLCIFQLCYKSKIYYPLGQGSAQLGRWRLPATAFNNFKLPVPPVAEQEIIYQFLENNKIIEDKLIQKIKEQIFLLKERRESLISHTITGKIEV